MIIMVSGKNGGRELDDQEVKIVRELIRNPRLSDNKISKKTKIPVMTVNRKRKKLESEMLLRYYCATDEERLGIFMAKQMYTIKFKIGITMKNYMDKLEKDPKWRLFNSKFISLAYLGEKDGHLALVIILDAPSEGMLGEEFNGKIIPFLIEKFGKNAVVNVETVPLTRMVRVHHNYMPATNMEDGRIKKDWPDEFIFVNEVE
jgi:DNA-binding Lrp family transcriptional regulator